MSHTVSTTEVQTPPVLHINFNSFWWLPEATTSSSFSAALTPRFPWLFLSLVATWHCRCHLICLISLQFHSRSSYSVRPSESCRIMFLWWTTDLKPQAEPARSDPTAHVHSWLSVRFCSQPVQTYGSDRHRVADRVGGFVQWPLRCIGNRNKLNLWSDLLTWTNALYIFGQNHASGSLLRYGRPDSDYLRN